MALDLGAEVSHRSGEQQVLQYQTYWTDPAQDDTHLDWVRRFPAEVYHDTEASRPPAGTPTAAASATPTST